MVSERLKQLKRFLANDEGTVGAEYAAMLALIALTCVVPAFALGDWMFGTFGGIVEALPEIQ